MVSVHDHAHEQQDEVDEQQDEETVVRDAEYAFHDGLRDLQHHIGLAQHHAAKNHDHDAAHGHGGILGAAEGIAQVQAPVDEEPDRQRVNYGYGGGFGGGHGPGIDAAEDEHGHDERRERLPAAHGDLPALFRFGELGHELEVEAAAQHEIDAAEDDDGDDAGAHRGQEAGEHVGARHPAEDDHGRARRNEHAEDGGTGDERGGEGAGIAPADHFGDQHVAGGGEPGKGTARNRAEDGAGEGGDETEPAPDAPDEHIDEFEQVFGDAALAHERPGIDEQRDAQKRGAQDLLEAPHHHAFHGDAAHDAHEGERAAETEDDGDAEGKEEHQNGEGNNGKRNGFHASLLPFPRAGRPGWSCRA